MINQNLLITVRPLTLMTFMLALSLPPYFAMAEEMPGSEQHPITQGRIERGALNAVAPEQSLLIIDDRSYVLDRVIQFNGAVWSREQVINRLEPGDRVEFVAGPVIDSSRGARQIKSLRVIN